MREGDHSEHAWRRDQCVDHELPAISSASMFAWQREALPAQNLPGHAMSVVLVIIAALQSVLTSGIVFGWAPLQLMLEEEGIYGDVCPDGPPCEEQAVKLDFMYTVATSTLHCNNNRLVGRVFALWAACWLPRLDISHTPLNAFWGKAGRPGSSTAPSAQLSSSLKI